MGDRCYVYVTVAAEDLDKFLGIEGGLGSPDSLDPNDRELPTQIYNLEYYEVNYGGVDEIRKAVEANIRMFVYQGPGSDYGAYTGISNGDGNYIEIPSINGELYLHVKVTDGKYEIDFEKLVDLQRFAVELKKAQDTWLD